MTTMLLDLYSTLESNMAARHLTEACGMVLPLLLFLAPLPLVVTQHRTMSVGTMPPLPFLAGLGTNLLWLIAGIGMQQVAMIVPNACGLVLHSAYVFVYFSALTAELRFYLTKAASSPETEKDSSKVSPVLLAADKDEEAVAKKKKPTSVDSKPAVARRRSQTPSSMKKGKSPARKKSTDGKKTDVDSTKAEADKVVKRRSSSANPRLETLVAKKKVFYVLLASVSGAAVFGVVALAVQKTQLVALLASALNVAMSGAPALALRTAWTTKDKSCLGSGAMLFAGLACSLAWTMIGAIWWKDVQVLVPNAIGLATSIVALMLGSWIDLTVKKKKAD
ncbi:unnamed protein product [Amoebophrya sp. A120]|nr:unnamed protein product [Amoebophrya sp. A120]|eukprot:GSA120T00005657001.1